MNNNLTVFENLELGLNVRAMEVNGDVWFVGKDIAEALGYTKARNAIAQHVDEDDALKQGITDSLGRNQQTTLINESGMYSLVLSSKLETAKKFRRWVTSEILPSIRKHGAYMTDNTLEQALTSPDFLIQLANKLKDEQTKRVEAERLVEEQKPKVLFAESLRASKTSLLIRDFVKILNQNGYDTGEKRFFQYLRENGYLMKNNMPTQKAMDQCLFDVNATTIVRSSGEIQTNYTSRLTGIGQYYFVKELLGKKLNKLAKCRKHV